MESEILKVSLAVAVVFAAWTAGAWATAFAIGVFSLNDDKYGLDELETTMVVLWPITLVAAAMISVYWAVAKACRRCRPLSAVSEALSALAHPRRSGAKVGMWRLRRKTEAEMAKAKRRETAKG